MRAAIYARAAVYARVSTLDQEPENQLQELQRYVEARGWAAQEFVDHGVSGTKDRRHALDRLIRDATQRKVDTVVVWRLDRLGRNLRHLVTLLDELQALGVGLCIPRGRDRPADAGWTAAHPHSGCPERIRKGAHRGTRPGWPGARQTARQASRSALRRGAARTALGRRGAASEGSRDAAGHLARHAQAVETKSPVSEDTVTAPKTNTHLRCATEATKVLLRTTASRSRAVRSLMSLLSHPLYALSPFRRSSCALCTSLSRARSLSVLSVHSPQVQIRTIEEERRRRRRRRRSEHTGQTGSAECAGQRRMIRTRTPERAVWSLLSQVLRPGSQ